MERMRQHRQKEEKPLRVKERFESKDGRLQGLYVGVDFHKKKSWLTGMDESGKVHFSFEMENTTQNWERALGLFPAGSKIAVEATWNWFWLLELVDDRFEVAPHQGHSLCEAEERQGGLLHAGASSSHRASSSGLHCPPQDKGPEGAGEESDQLHVRPGRRGQCTEGRDRAAGVSSAGERGLLHHAGGVSPARVVCPSIPAQRGAAAACRVCESECKRSVRVSLNSL